MKRIISIFLILVGLVFLSIPFLSQKIIGYKMRSNMGVLEELEVDDIKSNESLEGQFDFSSIRDVDVNSILKGVNENYRDAIVGHMIIADIGINLPILKGTTDGHLLVGATTMRKDQKLGEGNYPLAGHYMKNKDLLFGALMDIEKDMIVKITNKETIYEYKIYDTQIVDETAIHLIEDRVAAKKGKPIISLMSCYYTSKNGRRFFAFGELVDQYPYEIMKLAD